MRACIPFICLEFLLHFMHAVLLYLPCSSFLDASYVCRSGHQVHGFNQGHIGLLQCKQLSVSMHAQGITKA